MVAWTDFERATIKDIFSKIDYEVVGPAAISRCLIVYPWTQRYFGGFGNLYNAAAITSNPRVASHGKVIMEALEKAVKDMDNIKATYAELSALHSEKLQVDPDNFMSCSFWATAWPLWLLLSWVKTSLLRSMQLSRSSWQWWCPP
ncbi:hemoglobin subunit beta isoform X2 [Haplochromis burtoni]|uniref:hemoglobin subunit beta isoform X2 n=1 Tax=Haplochromis burtoni TaxID=8153 RepID=UPI001C2D471F|nr:hemoglobin subunit beta isoform X2 [Haplochromis burtoni]